MLILYTHSFSQWKTLPTAIPLFKSKSSHPLQISTPNTTQQNLVLSAVKANRNDRRSTDRLQKDIKEEEEESAEGDEFSSSNGFRGREEEKDYDRDPEFAEILGSCFDNPQKAQSRTIRSWHIVGRLGGLNSMNMQLSQAPLDKRPSYDAIQGANVTPTTFYNIGDLDIQDNLARLWVDIGTSEQLLLDVLINALTQISSDFIGIKQLVFGGSEFENWKESLTSEDAVYSVHKI
ncbi:uncharacterized protein LOC131217353 isoform X2 [Magnolia sinica]|uniref:uncharacterized protein LOC131217353 isoform X2 n=1 Tax=Magnolia sinica TaxID=86752 RepID=UPI0026598F07|nr:uncharacterized protein LOC131217353 isoform X2 [Magnolia sinica]